MATSTGNHPSNTGAATRTGREAVLLAPCHKRTWKRGNGSTGCQVLDLHEEMALVDPRRVAGLEGEPPPGTPTLCLQTGLERLDCHHVGQKPHRSSGSELKHCGATMHSVLSCVFMTNLVPV